MRVRLHGIEVDVPLLTVITGEPGTLKTSTMFALADAMSEHELLPAAEPPAYPRVEVVEPGSRSEYALKVGAERAAGLPYYTLPGEVPREAIRELMEKCSRPEECVILRLADEAARLIGASRTELMPLRVWLEESGGALHLLYVDDRRGAVIHARDAGLSGAAGFTLFAAMLAAALAASGHTVVLAVDNVELGACTGGAFILGYVLGSIPYKSRGAVRVLATTRCRDALAGLLAGAGVTAGREWRTAPKPLVLTAEWRGGPVYRRWWWDYAVPAVSVDPYCELKKPARTSLAVWPHFKD